ncbi:MAG: tetrahydrofolate dehydrogenase/cyclohydrolase catalytic domain-containing protein [Spirochaetota bacterium]
MAPILLDGKALSKKIKQQIKQEISSLQAKNLRVPTLATVLVGEDPASHTYVNMKIKTCESVGMKSRYIKLPQETTTEELLAKLEELNNDAEVDGILLQHPCPAQIDERKAFDAILEAKDVDGVTIKSFGNLSMGKETFYPCTPYGIMLILEEYKIPLEGKRAVVVGRSPILGKPMAMMLLGANATVTICHSRTQNLANIVGQADIIVGAVGKPEFIKAEWIQQGAVLLDAGYNPGNVGDIELSKAAEKSSYYTPVPGGVGPMTIAVLIRQTLNSAKKTLGA